MTKGMLNSDTAQTLVRAILKVGGGALVARGVANENELEVISAGLVTLVAVVWGVLHRHAEAKAEAGRLAAGGWNSLLFAGLLLAGCASANTLWFRAEMAATDAAYGAVASWNTHYRLAVTNRTGAKLVQLQSRNAEVHQASRDFAETVMVLDTLRESIATNSAATNRTALQAAVLVMREQSSNVVWLVRRYIE